jgi:polysaccharide deacetylase family sporulation protein PdaB
MRLRFRMRLPTRRRRLFIAIVLGLVAVGAYWYGVPGVLPPRDVPVFEHMTVVARGTELPVFYIKTDKKAVALTFDISWGTKTPDLVLPILRQHNQRATFFLSGPWAAKHEKIVKAIVSDGHEIASHGNEHVNLSQYDMSRVTANIAKADDVLRRISGKRLRFFRPPNGDYDDVVVGAARDLGYETIIWSTDSLDWKNPGAEYMVKRVVDSVFPGAIILCHSSDSSKQIHLALPGMIDGLKAKGYEIVTLGELWQAGSPGRDDPRGQPRSVDSPN